MKLDDYQEQSKQYDTNQANMDPTSIGFSEKVLGLVGEAGETADKVKKILRDKNGVISPEDKDEIVKELGDVLWYVAGLSRYLETPLSEVAKKNLDKLESRRTRNQIHGAGDNR